MLSIILYLLIILVTIGGATFMVVIKKRSLLSPLAIIPFFSFFYLSGWIHHIWYKKEFLSETDVKLLLISIIFLIFFLTGGSTKTKNKVHPAMEMADCKPILGGSQLEINTAKECTSPLLKGAQALSFKRTKVGLELGLKPVFAECEQSVFKMVTGESLNLLKTRI